MSRRIQGRGSVRVYPTRLGQIAITQDDDAQGTETSTVILDVNDVPLVVPWIQDAAAEAVEIQNVRERVDLMQGEGR